MLARAPKVDIARAAEGAGGRRNQLKPAKLLRRELRAFCLQLRGFRSSCSSCNSCNLQRSIRWRHSLRVSSSVLRSSLARCKFECVPLASQSGSPARLHSRNRSARLQKKNNIAPNWNLRGEEARVCLFGRAHLCPARHSSPRGRPNERRAFYFDESPICVHFYWHQKVALDNKKQRRRRAGSISSGGGETAIEIERNDEKSR